MIEIELKFQVSGEDREKLRTGATFKKRKVNIDVYYDTANFALVATDIWLRKRNGQFELKLPRAGNDKSSTSYEEIESNDEITKHFSFDPTLDLETSLQKNGYLPFATFRTERETYERDGVTLEFDSTVFDQDEKNPFVMVEAEIMVPNEADLIAEKNKLRTKVSEFGVELRTGGGKGGEYFKRYQPEVYKRIFHNQEES